MEYKLKNNFLSMVVNTFGAEMKSLIFDETELLWQANPEFWNRTAPVLFPITGGWESDSYILDNRIYRMQKHGFALRSDFNVISEQPEKIVMQLRSNDYTYSQFPFHFDFKVGYTLVKRTVVIRFDIENLSDTPLPFALGAHPGFIWPDKGNKADEICSLIFEKNESIRSFSTDGSSRPFLYNKSMVNLERNQFKKGAICLAEPASRWIDFSTGKRKIRIHKKNFKSLVLWTLPSESAGFICIEPVTGFRKPGSSFLDHNGIVTLKEKENCSFSYSIEILK